MGEPWGVTERWRVVETEELPGSRKRLKFIFRDGTSQYVTLEPRGFTEENIRLTGDHLAENPDLRQRR